MAGETTLARNIRELVGKGQMAIYQGIVTAVDGIACTVQFGSLKISDVRLRASMSDNDKQILIVPRKDTAVIVGSLSGDLSDLVVIKVDEIERIEINGGNLGGMINIGDLTDKLNNLVDEVNRLKDAFNSHVHQVSTAGTAASQSGTAAAVISKASPMTKFNSSDYEDTSIIH